MNKIVILGDLLVLNSESTYFRNGQFDNVIDSQICNMIFTEDCLCAINLEGPITNSTSILPKGDSPNLKSSTDIMYFLRRIPNLVISGANNHITDYMKEGVKDTEHVLSSNNIPFIEFASDKNNINSVHSFLCGDKNFCLFSIAQNEFSSARFNDYGAAGYDPLITFDEIAELKKKHDFIIVLYHAGKENYRYPTPEQQRICQKMVDCGADIVVCQHSHCIGCEENYNNGRIIYGTGNFLFNINNNGMSKESLVPVISVEEGVLNLQYEVIKRSGSKIELLKDKEKLAVLNLFYTRSEEILDHDAVKNKWTQYCIDNKDYLMLKGFTRIQSKVFLKIDLLTNHAISRFLFRNVEKNLLILNILRCEAINEMTQTIFQELTNKE